MNENLSPKNLAREGKAAYQKKEFLSAANSFMAASQGYKAGGDMLNAAEMANNASVAYVQAGEGAAAFEAVHWTIDIFAGHGDLRRQGMALGNQGAALEALGRFEEAIDAYQNSADVLQQAGEDQLRVNAMQSLSALQLQNGQRLQALATLQAGLEGVRHPTPKQTMLKRLLRLPFEMMNR